MTLGPGHARPTILRKLVLGAARRAGAGRRQLVVESGRLGARAPGWDATKLAQLTPTIAVVPRAGVWASTASFQARDREKPALLTLLWVAVDVTLGNCSWSSGEWWAEAAAGEVGHGDE
jgi:hypothetical protein